MVTFGLFVTFLFGFLFQLDECAVETQPFLHYHDLGGKPYTVTADERSWILNGKRTLLLGGSVHYPRLFPGQWKDILTKMLNDGLNHAEVYVFWNIHEPLYDFSGKHVYNYDGRANLTGFLAMAAEVGLFVNLRIGPYVCAEWSFGGLPTWLLHVPGIEFRANNQQWENYMQGFVEEIARISQPYLAKNGGPIVMAQIENEYGGSQQYVDWCGKLVTQLNMNVSWVMCNGMSASDTINTCNGNNCYNYAKAHSKNFPGQPMGWTENEGWFQDWTTAYDPTQPNWGNRSPEDMAYSVAIWFAAGGAHHNYYMWYGGNHVSWTAGSGIANYYADGVNYHSDGLANNPKQTHLMRLHNILSEYGEFPLLEDSIQVGHEIPLQSSANGTFSLMMSNCDSNSQSQEWEYDSNTGLLRASAFGNAHCVVSTGNSDPVATTQCNSNNVHQHWAYVGKEFKSSDNSCLDIFGETGPNVDEWSCKPSGGSDSKNQEWSINGKQIKSDLNGQCLSAEIAYNAFAYQYHSSSKNLNITFLCNIQGDDVKITWHNKQYTLPADSVTILDNDDNTLYCTATVNSTGLPTKRTYKTIYSSSDLSYSSWSEILPLTSNPQNRPDTPVLNKTPLEQIRFTNDTYEYLFYSTEFTASNNMNNVKVSIAGRKANAYLIYIDSNFVGSDWDGSHSRGSQSFDISLTSSISSGKHTITIVSSSLGIDNGIANQQPSSSQDMKGIVGSVRINTLDITDNSWNHWIGRTGEVLNITSNGMNKVTWKSPPVLTEALTWYKTTFNTPDDVNNNNGVILMDIGSKGSGMKRGHWWLNGKDMGHYNNVILSNLMVQQYYFIPNDYFTPNKGLNTLIFSEELSNTNPSNTNIVFSTFVVP